MNKKITARNITQLGLTFVIQHSFCCILPFVGALIGANILSFHNPLFELGLAIFGSFLGVQLDKYLHRKDIHDCHCHHDHDDVHGGHHHHEETSTNKLLALIKPYALPLVFAFMVWGAHQVLFHQHDDVADTHIEGSVSGHTDSH